MSKLHPVPKICLVKPAKKVTVNFRGWGAAAESPNWFAWPDGPTTKKSSAAQQQECNFFRSKSKKGRRGVFCMEMCFFW